MRLDGLGGRADAQLVAKALTQRLVHEQGLGAIAAHGMDLHQQAGPAFTEGRQLDQPLRRAFGRRKLAASDVHGGEAGELQGANAERVEPTPSRRHP